MVRPTKVRPGHGQVKTSSAKLAVRPIEGQLGLIRAPQKSTGLSLADKMPSLAKRGPFRLKEGPLSRGALYGVGF